MPNYIGRFAPSPSGPLHIGSLLTALLSYWDAKLHQGHWLLRIEDVDQTRSQKVHINSIIKMLRQFELHWDGDILLQSQRSSAYAEAIKMLGNHCYPCSCSRKSLGDQAACYPGLCRQGPLDVTAQSMALRLKLPRQQHSFEDRYQGKHTIPLFEHFGDVVLQRKDQFYAYHLAVVVDDALQQVTHVVRGQDLFTQTAIHTYLQELLHLPKPHYWHSPLILSPEGRKLSKSERAASLEREDTLAVLRTLFRFLGLEEIKRGVPTRQALIDGCLQWQEKTALTLAKQSHFTLSDNN